MNIFHHKKLKNCERRHFKFKVGDKVISHTGSYGGEQGQMSPSWWPEEKEGVVIEVVIDKCLVEFIDKSRLWCNNHSMSARLTERTADGTTPWMCGCGYLNNGFHKVCGGCKSPRRHR